MYLLSESAACQHCFGISGRESFLISELICILNYLTCLYLLTETIQLDMTNCSEAKRY